MVLDTWILLTDLKELENTVHKKPFCELLTLEKVFIVFRFGTIKSLKIFSFPLIIK